MMENIVFKSDLFFELMDFSLSHKVLLIRGTEVIKSNEEYISHRNIDLLFGSVQFMQIPSIFEGGIIIRKGKEDKVIKIGESTRILRANDYFEIHNNKIIYFIESYNLEVLENDLDRAESSIDGKKFRTSEEEKIEKLIPNIEDTKYKMNSIKNNISEMSIWLSLDLKTKKELIQIMIVPHKYKEETLNHLIDFGNDFHRKS